MLASTIVAVAGLPVQAAAQSVKPDERAVFSAQIENDLWGAGTDRHFTHGTRLSYLSPVRGDRSLAKRIANWLPFIDGGNTVRTAHAVGQSIFTPEDITRTDLILDDRPYAGWLFTSLGLVLGPKRKTNAQPGTTEIDRLESLELTVGVIGPHSFAQDTQEFVHEVIGSTDPQGWDNQLETEPGIMIAYETRFRTEAKNFIRSLGLKYDVTPSYGATVGNVMMFGGGNVTLRIGDDLANDFGPPRIRPSLPGSDYYASGGKFGWYFFAGFGARAVARNIFLDGNTFRGSHSVNKKPVVFDVQAGLVFSLWGRARLAFTNIPRSKEFDGQDEGDEFGAISLSFRL